MLKKHVQKIKVFIYKYLNLLLEFKRKYMRTNRRKHQILEALTNHWLDGETKSVGGFKVTEVGRCLNNMQLHLKTGIKIQKIDSICFTLANQGFISSYSFNEGTKLHTYLIEDAGRVAVFENSFKNLIWWRNFDLWKWVLPLIISVIAVIIALVH